MDAVAIERRLREFFKARSVAEGIAAAWLFGSVARGTRPAGQRRGCRRAVREDPPRTLAGYHFDLEADLQELLGLPVQLVVLNRAPVDLTFRVMQDGKLLVNQDPSRRIRFELRTHNEYWDMEPSWRLYRKERGGLASE